MTGNCFLVTFRCKYFHFSSLDNACGLQFPAFNNGCIFLWQYKTHCVALVLCLNVGVDPPDVVKTQPCARLECWIGECTFRDEYCLIIYQQRSIISNRLRAHDCRQIPTPCRQARRWSRSGTRCRRSTSAGSRAPVTSSHSTLLAMRYVQPQPRHKPDAPSLLIHIIKTTERRSTK